MSAASTTTGRVPYKSLTKSPSANTMDVLDTHSTQSAENIGPAELESQKPPAFAFAVVTAGRALGAVSPSIAALSAVNRRSTRNGPERRVGKCLLQQVHAKMGSDQTVSSIQEITGGAISCRKGESPLDRVESPELDASPQMNPTKFPRVASPRLSARHSPAPIPVPQTTVAFEKIRASESKMRVCKRTNISPQISRNPREVLRPKPLTPLQNMAFSSSNEKRQLRR